MTSGVGKESLAAALLRLAESTGRSDPAGAIAMGEEILSFAGILSREPRLRRALADSSRPAVGRIGLLRSLVADRIGADALGVLTTLVGGRWAHASELLCAAERLGVEAFLSAAEQTGALADVEDELFRFSRIVSGDARLASVLGAPSAGSRREGLVRDLLEGKANPMTLRLGRLALAGLGGRGFAGSMTWLVEATARRRERKVAYVTTAVALTADEERRLATILGQRYGGTPTLKIMIDPTVLGGVLVQVGADVLDGTVRRMLGDARHAMTR